MNKILSTALMFSIMSCSKHTFFESIKNQQINVGSSGGFIGGGSEYILTSDGVLNKKNALNDSVTFISQLDSNTTKSFFKKIKRLDLEAKNIDQPGNMSKFIIYREPKKFKYKAVWGNSAYKAPKSITKFYDSFIKLIQ